MNEIEEFLRRAAALRAQKAQQAQGQPPAEPPPRAPQPSPLTRVTVTTRPAGPGDVLEAEVIEDDAVSGDDVIRYVQQHLDTKRFQERASNMAERVRSADEVIEARLHSAFEHRLGQLGAETSKAEDSTLDDEENKALKAQQQASASAGIAQMLRSPQSIRDAIVMSEILRRPEDRW